LFYYNLCLSPVTFYAKYVNMADTNSLTKTSPTLSVGTASPLFLREAEIRRGIELLYFGYTNMVRGADGLLTHHGFGRAHHRALYFIARRPGLSVGDLLQLLNITKQSLSRVLAELQAADLVVQEIGARDRRQRLLRLSSEGTALEAALYEELRTSVADAYAQAGQNAVSGFWAVLTGLIPVDDRPLIAALQAEL
jgi:DNA-binding MarR family transcriptional regulator